MNKEILGVNYTLISQLIEAEIKYKKINLIRCN